ncbi:MAG: acyl-CoA dehydrogenase family protein [Bacillota bacterium]
MDFSFDDVQQSMAKVVRNFAGKVLLPKYGYWDRKEEFPREQWIKMAGLGLLGLRVSARYGGQEADSVTAGLIAEEVARGDFNCAYAVLLTCLVGDILDKFATGEVKRSWLAEMVRGEKVICLALTEPHAGSDAAALKTRAVRKGDTYVLNGEKSAISLLMAADAAVVFARTDPEARTRGISAFLVPLDLPGVTRQSYQDMGSKAIVRGSLFLDDVAVPAECLIGPEGGGFVQVMQAFDYSRVIIALMCLGAAQITIEETAAYVKQRSAFGQPLARFEGISFPLVEWLTRIEAARWLCYRALWLRDRGLPHTREAAMCKWLCPEIAVDAIHECLIIHGHYGYTREFPVEQRLRDVIGLQIGDGTPQVQKIIIAREVFGREFLPY